HVRLRTMWALHRHDLLQIDAVPTYTRILEETAYSARMARYYAAMGLARTFGPETPERALDALRDFLRDTTGRIYAGTDAAATKAGAEARQGNGKVKAKLTIDSRFLAADALAHVGPRLQDRPDVLAALTALADGPATEPRVRQAARRALQKAGAARGHDPGTTRPAPGGSPAGRCFSRWPGTELPRAGVAWANGRRPPPGRGGGPARAGGRARA